MHSHDQAVEIETNLCKSTGLYAWKCRKSSCVLFSSLCLSNLLLCNKQNKKRRYHIINTKLNAHHSWRNLEHLDNFDYFQQQISHVFLKATVWNTTQLVSPLLFFHTFLFLFLFVLADTVNKHRTSYISSRSNLLAHSFSFHYHSPLLSRDGNYLLMC